jgi:hypothetical protein
LNCFNYLKVISVTPPFSSSRLFSYALSNLLPRFNFIVENKILFIFLPPRLSLPFFSSNKKTSWNNIGSNLAQIKRVYEN